MNLLKLISTQINHENGSATAVFRVVDAFGKPVAKEQPVGLIIPSSVVDLTALPGNTLFELSFKQVTAKPVLPPPAEVELP